MAISGQQRKILLDLVERLAALEPEAFDYVAKSPEVSRETMDELEQAGLVETFLATGYGEVLFYHLTSTSAEVLSDASG